MATPEPRFGFDPVAAFLGDRERAKSLAEERDSIFELSADSVPRSIAGLYQLSRSYAWAAVLDLATSLLSQDDDIRGEVAAIDQSSGENDQKADRKSTLTGLLPHERLECAAYRSLALFQTRQVERAAVTISKLGDLSEENESYLYESFPELYPASSGLSGSFVPFSLRALSVEIRLQADPDAIEDLYVLRRDCVARAAEATDEPETRLWRAREAQTLSSLALAHLRAEQHDSAADIARALVAQQGGSARALYMYARVLLHVGDMRGAREVLARADARPDGTPALRLVHEGLALAANCAFLEAATKYDAAVQLCEGGDTEMQMLWAFASNNSAICLLHIGRLAEAIEKLEECVRENPRVALDEGIVLNIATLYDLAFPDSAAEKKAVLKSLASKYGRQGFDLNVINET